MTRNALLALVFVVAPRAAFACPVCFGQSDSPMAIATNTAIFFMLGVTAFVLGAFGLFVAYLVRRAELVEDSAGHGEPARPAVDDFREARI